LALGCLRRHPLSPAMTGGQTPHRTTGPSKCPPCVRCAPQGARGRVRYAQSGPASPHCVEASCVSSDWKRSPLRRSTWDFWPGPVLAVLPSSAFAKGFGGQGAARLRPLSKASRGSLGSPSGIVRLSSHGSSLPEGAGLADLPGAVASRIRGRHGLTPPCKDAPRRRPSGPRLVQYVVDQSRKVNKKILFVSKKLPPIGPRAFPCARGRRRWRQLVDFYRESFFGARCPLRPVCDRLLPRRGPPLGAHNPTWPGDSGPRRKAGDAPRRPTWRRLISAHLFPGGLVLNPVITTALMTVWRKWLLNRTVRCPGPI